MAEPLNWERDGINWPHRQASQFIQAVGLRWHVQRLPMVPAGHKGPVESDLAADAYENTEADAGTAQPPTETALLIHGTGASCHSWRDVMPLLVKKMQVIAVDLPGHGFTQSPNRDGKNGDDISGYSIEAMAASVHGLLRVMRLTPTIAIGHSAGAAILMRMVLDKKIAPARLVSINGAMLPLTGVAGEIFSPIAKLISKSALVPRLFAWRARDLKVRDRLIDATGSKLDDVGRQLYGRLITNTAHAGAALSMMANWDLGALEKDLPAFKALNCHLILIVGENDRTVSPREATRVKNLLSTPNEINQVTIVSLPQLGHLAHEESPDVVVDHILQKRVER